MSLRAIARYRNVVFVTSFALFIRFCEPLLHLGVAWRLYIFYPILCLAGLILFQDVFRNAWSHFRHHPYRVIAAIAGAFILNIVLAALIYALQPGDTGAGSGNDKEVARVMHAFSPWVTLPVLGVLGVIVEELVFRHILIGQVADRFGKMWIIWGCVIVSAILFGFYHLRSSSDMASVPIYIASGFSFGLCYVASGRNIFATIFWHATNNVLALVSVVLAR